MKKFIILFAAAILMVLSCEPMSIEENVEKPNVDNIYTTIHYSLKSVSTGTETKVSYDATNGYSIKTGDKLSIAGKDRDITGTLIYNTDAHEWQGDLTYKTSEGELVVGTTDLVATLIHADNTNATTYANAVVGSDQSSMLKYAVEHYSLLTANYNFGDETITLKQQAAFLDVNVTFTGAPQLQAGTTYADIETPAGTASGTTQLVAAGSNFTAHFMAVVPAGHNVQDFKITLCDRDITFDNSATLSANKKYMVNRTIAFKPQNGDPFWSDGTYGRTEHSDPNVSIVGIIVYVNQGNATGNAITEETSGFGHGLVMALHNVPFPGSSSALWGADGGVRWRTTSTASTRVTPYLVTKPSETLDANKASGLTNTNAIIDVLGSNSAAYLAKNYSLATAPSNTSGWFLPSIGQWMYTISTDGFGGAKPATDWTNNDGKNWLTKGNIGDLVRVMDNNGSTENLLVKSLNDRLELLKAEFAPDENDFYDEFGWSVNGEFGDNYWTSSEKADNEAFRMNLGSVETDNQGNKHSTIKPKGETKTRTQANYKSGFIMRIRPFLAF